MTVALTQLVQDRALAVRPLTGGFEGVTLRWAHASDLDDPSPFLEPGQMLLTTGRQFASFDGAAEYADYVARLVRAGIVALGFGTEVLRVGTPSELIDACEAAGLALVEVPFATPFIAIIKFVADRLAAESRLQIEAALAAQEAISNAVLGSGGLAAAVRSAESALASQFAVLDSDGELLEGGAPNWLRDRALELLRRGRRARDSGEEEGGSWIAQTLGRSGHLLGAVVALRPSRFMSTETSVVTMLTALTELALEHAEDQRLSFRSIGLQLFELLCAGRVGAVREALAHHSVNLPLEPFRVMAVVGADVPAPLRDSLERMAAGPHRRLFAVQRNEEFVLLVDATGQRSVESRLAEAGLRVGMSAETTWPDLGEALAQASLALVGAPARGLLSFDELRAGTVLGLFTDSRVAELARLKLGPRLRSDEGRIRLQEVALWLQFNGAWEPAARALGIHRHTLKQRVEELGHEIGLPLETFRGRAELWTLLVALDLAAG
jgi:purine catabolism regulator